LFIVSAWYCLWLNCKPLINQSTAAFCHPIWSWYRINTACCSAESTHCSLYDRLNYLGCVRVWAGLSSRFSNVYLSLWSRSKLHFCYCLISSSKLFFAGVNWLQVKFNHWKCFISLFSTTFFSYNRQKNERSTHIGRYAWTITVHIILDNLLFACHFCNLKPTQLPYRLSSEINEISDFF
jgi:hypothetical protein